MGTDHHQHPALPRQDGTAHRDRVGERVGVPRRGRGERRRFLFGLGHESLGNLVIVAGLALGGALAAPVAAWLVSRVPATLLGTGVGGVIVLTNAHKLAKTFELSGAALAVLYLAIVAAWLTLLMVSWKRSRLTPAEKSVRSNRWRSRRRRHCSKVPTRRLSPGPVRSLGRYPDTMKLA